MKFFLNKFSALVILSLALLSPLFAAESKTIGFAFHHDGKICALSEAYDPNNEWGINVEASQNILPDLLKVTKESWGQIEFLEQRKGISHLMIDEEQAHFLPVTLTIPDNMDNITTAAEDIYNLIVKQVWPWLIEEQDYCFKIRISLDGMYIGTNLPKDEENTLTPCVAARVAQELGAINLNLIGTIWGNDPSFCEKTLDVSLGSSTSYSECAKKIYSKLVPVNSSPIDWGHLPSGPT